MEKFITLEECNRLRAEDAKEWEEQCSALYKHRDELDDKRKAAEAEVVRLREALLAVEEWWLREAMHRMFGAPVCIFMVRAALAPKEEQ